MNRILSLFNSSKKIENVIFSIPNTANTKSVDDMLHKIHCIFYDKKTNLTPSQIKNQLKTQTEIIKMLQKGGFEILIQNQAKLNFESIKKVATITCYLIRNYFKNIGYILMGKSIPKTPKNNNTMKSKMKHIINIPDESNCGVLIKKIIDSLNDSSLFNINLSIIYVCLDNKELRNILINQYKIHILLFKFIATKPRADVSFGSFSILKSMILDKNISADLSIRLVEDYENISKYITTMMRIQENFIIKRQIFDILQLLCLNPIYYKFYIKFASMTNHLIEIMKIMKNGTRVTQFYASGVFCIFLANPHKNIVIKNILKSNKKSLTGLMGKLISNGCDFDSKSEKLDIIIEKKGLNYAKINNSSLFHYVTSLRFIKESYVNFDYFLNNDVQVEVRGRNDNVLSVSL